MSEIQITIEDIAAPQGKTIKLVKFTGQLDETNVDEKSKMIYDVIDAVPKALNLIFDFSELEYMNSKSVGYLTDWYTKVSEKGGEIIIAGSKPNIVDILEVVGLTQIIKFVGSVEEAKASLGGSAQPNPVTQKTMQDQGTTPPPGGDQSVPAAPVEPTPAPEVTPAQPAAPVEPTLTPEAPAPVAPVEPTLTPEAPAPAPEQPAQPANEQGSVEITKDAPPA